MPHGGSAAGGADVDNSTSYQCFKPQYPVRREVLRSWRAWLQEVLQNRVVDSNGNIQQTQYRAGSSQTCADPAYPANGNLLSQNMVKAMSEVCGYTDWKGIVEYFYTGNVVGGSAPPNPVTSFTRVGGGIQFTFQSKVGGSLVAWSYVLQRNTSSGWRTIYNRGWSKATRSVPTTFTYLTGTCTSYRVKGVNPVGSSVYSSFNSGNSICPS